MGGPPTYIGGRSSLGGSHHLHKTIYPQYRPGLLGSNLLENIIKDYNGQTYWLSVNPASFAGSNTSIPNWVNITLGYGAEGMTGGHANPQYTSSGDTMPHFQRYRQYYLSLTPDFSRLDPRPSFYRTYYDPLQITKLPFPALEYSREHFAGHWLYY